MPHCSAILPTGRRVFSSSLHAVCSLRAFTKSATEAEKYSRNSKYSSERERRNALHSAATDRSPARCSSIYAAMRASMRSSYPLTSVFTYSYPAQASRIWMAELILSIPIAGSCAYSARRSAGSSSAGALSARICPMTM